MCVAANIPRRHRTGRWANQTTAKGGSVARVLLPGCCLAMPLCPGGCYFSSSCSCSCSCSSVSCNLSIKINESFRCVAGVQILERASPRRFQLAENQFIRFPTWYRGACLKLKNNSSIYSNSLTIWSPLPSYPIAGSCDWEHIATMRRISQITLAPWLSIGGRSVHQVSVHHRFPFDMAYYNLRGFCISRTLANHCHNIEHLDLSECKKITDLSVTDISRYCNKLTAINLDSCSNITDNSLKYISDGCPVS